MKIRSALLFVGIIIPLVIMQLSCATQEKAQNQATGAAISSETAKPAEAPPVKAPEAPAEEKKAVQEEQPAAANFLADKHKTSGVSCSDCHKESTSKEPTTDMCMTCHSDYKDKATSAVDPHNAHVSFSNCGDCHHGHKASENQCQGCHNFNIKTP
jgi:hypothetical protein